MGLKLTRPGFPGRGRGVPVYVRHLYVIFSSTPLIYWCPVWTTNYLLPSLSLRACKSNIFKMKSRAFEASPKRLLPAGRKCRRTVGCRSTSLCHTGKEAEGISGVRVSVCHVAAWGGGAGAAAGVADGPGPREPPLLRLRPSPVCLFQSPPAVLPTSDPFLGTSSAFSLQPGEPSPPPPSSRRLRCGRVSPPLHVRSVGAERACACRGGGGRAGP